VSGTENQVVGEVDPMPDSPQDWRGVDLTLIRHCLDLTPTERIAENEAALSLFAVERPVARAKGPSRTL